MIFFFFFFFFFFNARYWSLGLSYVNSNIGGKLWKKIKFKMQDIGHSYGKSNIGGKIWKKNKI